MEVALALDVSHFDVSAERRSAWAHQVARMSRRLELRWNRDAMAAADPELEALRFSAGAARAAFDDVMESLAG